MLGKWSRVSCRSGRQRAARRANPAAAHPPPLARKQLPAHGHSLWEGFQGEAPTISAGKAALISAAGELTRALPSYRLHTRPRGRARPKSRSVGRSKQAGWGWWSDSAERPAKGPTAETEEHHTRCKWSTSAPNSPCAQHPGPHG